MDDNSPGFVSTRPSSAGLGPQGEAEWQRLRAQLELAEGFWLGFVFVQSRADAEELRRRVEGFLRASVRRMTSLEPKSPGYLRRSLGELLEHGATDLMWLQAVERGAQRPSLSGTDPEDRQDDSDPADESWDTAWSDTLLRANEHRERLRNEIGDGLVFVLPTPLKPEVRRTAPDLWSIRSLVLEVEPVKRGPELSAASFRGLPSPASDPLRPLSATEPDDTTEVDESIDPTEPAETLLRRARARLLDHRPRAAALLAAEVAERLEREHDPRFADVLAFQAEAEVESGDPISALAHIGRANALKAENVPERGDLNWLDLQFKLALRVGDLDQASRAAEALLSRARTLHNGARTPEALRDLSTSLDNVGDVRRDQGRLDDAANAYDESLDIARRLANDYAPTPEALRDLSVSWNKVGDVRRDQGRLEDAANAFDESLDLARRLANDAPTPEALRDLSVSWNKVGDVRRARGLLEDAGNAHDESLDIRRRLANDYGPT
ncbi:MAG: tetratricopeptide repeat protein, partial [Acidobacteriota bacterium]